MLQLNTSVVLPDDTPMTFRQLIQAAIAAREYDSAQQETDAINRMSHGPVREGIIRPMDNIYLMDAYKDEHVEADFTAEPGGGEILLANQVKVLANGMDLSRLVYQNSGGNVVIYLDISLG